MNTDERGFFDSVTERVIGAVFEVSGSYLKMDFAIRGIGSGAYMNLGR